MGAPKILQIKEHTSNRTILELMMRMTDRVRQLSIG